MTTPPPTSARDLDRALPHARDPEGDAREAWRPLASGALAERTMEVVQDIARCFSEPLPAWAPAETPAAARAAIDASLAGGAAGQMLLHVHLASVAGRPAEERERAQRCLEVAMRAAASVEMEPALFGGFTGIAWAMEHVARLTRQEAGEDPLDSIDDLLVSALAAGSVPAHFDLVSGLVGIGVYALERMPRARARECLRLVVERLGDRAEPGERGLSWRTPPDALAATPRRPMGPFDLGVAHGIAGVVALLGAASAWDVAGDRARGLLQGAVGWLLGGRLPDGQPGAFAASAGPGCDPRAARLAWCYGDAGIAVTLLGAARASGRPDWEEAALSVARRAAARAEETSGVRDACLCHGAAGLALVFQRLHHATGEPAFAEAGKRWLTRTLEMRRPGEDCAGYPTWLPAEDGAPRWVEDPGLLCGPAGIALALLAAATPTEPEWDRMLLLSTRRPSG